MLHHAAAVVAAAALAVAACGTDPKPSGPSCDERVDRFAAQLAPLANNAGVGVMVPGEIEPVVSTKGAPVDGYGPTLVIERSGAMTMSGERVANDDALRERLAAEVEMMKLRDQRVGPFYVWADKATPAARIARVAALAPEGVEARVLLAAPEVAPSPYQRELLDDPQVAKFRRGLDERDPSSRAVFIAEQMEKAIGTCTPMIKAFGSVAGLDATRKGPFMVDAVPKALRECKCGVADQDLFEYAMLAVLGAFDRGVTWVPAAQAGSYFAG